jgi:integrase
MPAIYAMKKDHAPETELRVWDYATGVPDLVRHNTSGRYYARFQVAGKRRMKALKTAVWSVAKLRLSDELAKAERLRQSDRRVESGNLLIGDLLDRHQEEYLANTSRAERSKQLVKDTTSRLVRQWGACFDADLRATKPGKITSDQVRRFSNYLHAEAVHRQNNAKNSKRGYKAITVNKTIELLHRILRRAVAAGALMMLPFELRPANGESFRKPVETKKLRLPSSAKMREVFAEMRKVPDAPNLSEMREYLVQRGEESAELAEFMAFSGARVSEAVAFVWEDEQPDSIILRGTKTEGSRNREVPKVRALRELLRRMRRRRKAAGTRVEGRVFAIHQCREALESACKRVDVDRLTHHSLRHFFATICIESGVDIPTISRWLGHSDGGVLAMKTYGHLRIEHSVAAAKTVIF